MHLRPELVRIPRADGGLDLFDPLLDRLHILSPDEAASLFAPAAALATRLSQALLVEGPAAQRLRAQVVAARHRVPPRQAPVETVPAVDWAEAEELPDGVSTRWRDGEGLRRAAEERAAGRGLTVLRGFLAPAFCEVVGREAQALPQQRLDTDLVHAWRHPVQDGLHSLREILAAPVTRQLLGAVLGVPLDEGLVVNTWRLEPGDFMAAHPDGPRYQATFSLGLCRGWTAADGGAIAFGTPHPDGGLSVNERFLPQLGDLALFVPTATTWHQVEPPGRTRWTVSGWWLP